MAEQGTLRVLLVEDSDDDARLIEHALRRAGYPVALERVASGMGMAQALHAGHWDVILADYSLPGFGALAALRLLHDTGRDLPFIIVSGTIDEEQAVTALRAGAHDFVTKANLARLGPAIDRERREAENRRQRRQAEVRLRETMDAMLEGAQLIGFDWRYLYVNDAAAGQGRQPREALLGRTMMDAYPGIEQTPYFAALGACMAQRSARRTENEFTYPDGERGWFELVIQPAPEGLLILSRDITERKQFEAQIQRQLSRLSALRAIDLAITSSLDLRLTLDVFLDQVLQQLAVDAADVWLLDPASQTLTFAAGRGFRAAPGEPARLGLGAGRAGRAVVERRTITAHGPGADTPAAGGRSPRTGRLEPEGFLAYYGVPLIAKGQALGVLELFHRAPLNPAPEWLEFLEALAGQAAIAVENATLFDTLQRSHRHLLQAYDETIEGWSRALDLRDHETEGHSQRVTDLTLRMARLAGVDAERLQTLRFGALLHDIGKLGVPDAILLKPGPLSEDEWKVMRRHPALAHQMLSPIEFLRDALEIPFCHHEKWDGTGYPRGLKGEAIPLAARLFAVVDVWDALRSDRPYRPAWTAERARAEILALAGSHFEGKAVELFEKVMGDW
jgi:PAS domain S-box-containing protein